MARTLKACFTIPGRPAKLGTDVRVRHAFSVPCMGAPPLGRCPRLGWSEAFSLPRTEHRAFGNARRQIVRTLSEVKDLIHSQPRSSDRSRGSSDFALHAQPSQPQTVSCTFLPDQDV